MSRRSLTYETRLYKYAKRGFAVQVPGLEPSVNKYFFVGAFFMFKFVLFCFALSLCRCFVFFLANSTEYAVAC